MYKTLWVAAAVAAALVVGASCDDDETEVAVGGTHQGDAGAGNEGGGGEGGGSGCLAFGDSCQTGDTCCDVGDTPGECYPYGMGPRCSIPCPADPANCPNNGRGCNTETPAECKPP